MANFEITGTLTVKDKNQTTHIINGSDFGIDYDTEQGDKYRNHTATYENEGFSISVNIEERDGEYINGLSGLDTDNCTVQNDNLNLVIIHEREPDDQA
jgi:hypothetical protein